MTERMFTFAHCSDLHLPPLPTVEWRRLLGKRLLSYQSWHRKRRHYHLAEVADALQRDLEAFGGDHVCVTGDLANLGLAEEIAAAANWLRRLGPMKRVSLVPGNHDIYAFDSYASVAEHWQGWMGDEFPYVHRRGPVAFVGLSTGLPTAPLFATGTLGDGQLAALGSLLTGLKEEGLCRILLLHHSPMEGVRWRKRLSDADAFRGTLAAAGAELILHGHLHQPLQGDIAGPGGRIPVLGAGSGSGSDGTHAVPGHYYRFRLDDDWRLSVESRQYERAAGGWREAAAFDLPLRQG